VPEAKLHKGAYDLLIHLYVDLTTNTYQDGEISSLEWPQALQ